MRLVECDALDLASHARPGSAQLAYLDPPFNVGAEFVARTQRGESRGRKAGGSSPSAYMDRWPSLDAYLGWLEPRVDVARSLLSERGTMWLHLDQRAVHEAKLACDRVFGRRAFIGEVVWVPANGSKSKRGPGVGHQTLLLYARTSAFVWNAKDPSLRAPFAATSLAMHFRNTDAAGRHFRDRTIGGKTYRYYADEGRAIGSVWTDCPAMVANTPLCDEGTGYPTQKPLKLLDRIIRASTEPGELVVDPFCGSGTTLHAAARAGRDAVGSDIGSLAVSMTARRLTDAGIAFERVEDEETGRGRRDDAKT